MKLQFKVDYRDGFTLIEVLICLILLAMISLTLVGYTASNLRRNSMEWQLARTTREADSLIENYQNMVSQGWFAQVITENITTPDGQYQINQEVDRSFVNATGGIETTIDPGAGTILDVTVTVTLLRNGQPTSISVTRTARMQWGG